MVNFELGVMNSELGELGYGFYLVLQLQVLVLRFLVCA